MTSVYDPISGRSRSGSATHELIEELLDHVSCLWLSAYGNEGYIPGRTSTTEAKFLWAAERIYYRNHKEMFPDLWRVPERKPELQTVWDVFVGEIPPEGAFVIYFHFNKVGAIIYIGKSTQFATRQRAHRSGSHWWADISRIEIELLDDEVSMSALEIECIKKWQPKWNKDHKNPVLTNV